LTFEQLNNPDTFRIDRKAEKLLLEGNR